MATPTIREVVSAGASGTGATVTTGAGTAVGDVLVCFAGNDYYTAAGFGSPSGTAGTWTNQVTSDPGANGPHLKIWTRPVTVGGAQTVTVSPAIDEEATNTTFVLAGADTTTPNDGAAAAGTGTSASMDAPAVTPTTTDALLLCGVQSEALSAATFTPPTGMTERSDFTAAGATPQSTASLVLAASGSTGVKTFTSTVSAQYASASIAIQGASAGGATSLVIPRRAARGLILR